MDIGVDSTSTNTGTVDAVVEDARVAAAAGLASFWVPNYFGLDALTCLAIVGREVADLRLGTAVVPIYTRHPFAMAQQALTVQAAVGGRLTLGIGLSHKPIVEGAWGLAFEKPAATMQAYLESLAALTAPADDGQPAQATVVPDSPTPPSAPGATRLPVLVAALGPRMVELAGSLADGVVLWCMGPIAIADAAPRLRAAAQGAGRPAPRIVASLPVCVTGDADTARSRIAQRFGSVDALASYRRALDAEGGTTDISHISLVGDESEVVAGLRRLEDAGVTEFAAMITGSRDERAATLDALSRAATS